MNEANEALGGSANAAVAKREKTWDERTDAERVQILRDEVRSMRIYLRDVSRRQEKLSRHQHGANGDILIPLYSAGDAEVGGYDRLR